MHKINWIIALLGLWELGDIAALFVPGFGEIKPFVRSHIITGALLVVLGVWAARTSSKVLSRRLDWVAAAAGAWLIAAPFILGLPDIAAGVWNDVIVGALVVILAVWAAQLARGKLS